MKKILALLLTVLMVGSVLVSCNSDAAGTNNSNNQVIFGNTTELSGDFRFPGWGGSSAGAADQDINRLTAGYATMETDQSGSYVWNKTVVKSHTEGEDADGNFVVTIEINPGLKFSNGTEITAANYVASILAYSTQVVASANHPGKSGQTFVGYDAFNAYVGEEADGASKTFKGIRLLGDYQFSLTVTAPDYYPYYFAYTYGAVSPDDLTFVFGDGATVKDDGEGCYIDGNWYDKDANGEFVKKAHIEEARYDTSKYPFSGPYVIKNWDKATKEATLEINPEYIGNFERQKPSIKTIVYRKLVEETQLDMFKTGEVDILAGITGGEATNSILAVIDQSEGKFAETHYQRAGYGKLEFECDFGPTMFASARKAVAYTLDTGAFAQAFTGGYGTVIYGPYSPDFEAWKAVKDNIKLIDYSFSIENAKKALEEDGWIYNSKGEAYVEGQTGVDAVRYKKLTAEEAEILDGVNKNFASVENTDGITYQTVQVGDDYYMPLAINWFGTENNSVTEMLRARMVGTDNFKAIGMVVRCSVGDFTKLLGEIYRDSTMGYGGTPTYGMFNLATGWNSSIYDYAYNWSLDPAYFDYSANKLYDAYDKAFPYYDANGDHTKMSYADAMKASGNQLGMDYISMAMVYDASTADEYNEWFRAYLERWNDLMPDIPTYSNYYFDAYNAKIQNFKTSPFFGPDRAILYCTIK